jgi:asparagine synthase (glutamine-hydrolysing)
MTSASFDSMYEQLMAQWPHPSQVLLKSNGHMLAIDTPAWGKSLVERMRYRDLMHYLPDDILVKVDRATMDTSLESRAPLLDHRVVEFAFSLPRTMLIRDSTTKWLLRQVLYQFVPKHLIERPKAGFGIPLGQWLRGSLRDWAESLLSERALQQEAFFEPSVIRRIWSQHIAGTHDRQAQLWSVLMFQAWHSALRRAVI